MGSGAAARRERNRQEMQESILAATQRIVAEKGVDALTMRGVADEIGYSVAALYEYFPSKEHLLGCLYFAGSDGFAGRLHAAHAKLPATASALDRLLALGHAYRAYAREQPDLYRLVLGTDVPDMSPASLPTTGGGSGFDTDEAALDSFGLLVSVARDGVERGEFLPLPPEMIAVSAWAAVHGFVMLELTGHLAEVGPAAEKLHDMGEPPTPDELFAAMMQLQVLGVRRR